MRIVSGPLILQLGHSIGSKAGGRLPLPDVINVEFRVFS